MPSCDPNKIIAQTLFLGASVSNFNASKGWGGQPSQLTVTLVEDFSTQCGFTQQLDLTTSPELDTAVDTALGFNTDTKNFPANHYHTCAGDSCYVEKVTGAPFNSSTMRSEDRMVPGKVFYEYNNANGIFSKYWYNSDPGFFGKNTKITPNGTMDISVSGLYYDIIDTPVYFKMGDFSFGGIVQSWTENTSQNGQNITVTIMGVESILNNCYIILNKFAGAVYSQVAGSNDNQKPYAGPNNYAGRGKDQGDLIYYDEISNGNIPNVFNVYGFLESLSPGGFGGANVNSEGVSANKVIDALKVLTSSIKEQGGQNLAAQLTGSSLAGDSYKDYGPKTAFSPFGRIITKCMQRISDTNVGDTYIPIDPAFKRFGVIAPETPYFASGSVKCEFLLDLSDLPELPDDFRIPGDVITITDLLNIVTDQSGYDYHVSLYPVCSYQKNYNIIKVHTISRLSQPRTDQIKNTINYLKNVEKINVSSISYGKEKNETHARHLIIGGSQQRLYQAKSLRLAYSQSNYIFDPTSYKFIDYMKLGSIDLPAGTAGRANIGSANTPYHHGKVKLPTALSTHNYDVAKKINPVPLMSGVYDYNKSRVDKVFNNLSFTSADSVWNDKFTLSSSALDVRVGNYGGSFLIQQSGNPATWGNSNSNPERFFPLHLDVICPFFGFVQDNEITMSATDNNDFRKIRPVWFDTWTGQTVVVVKPFELPITSINLEDFAPVNGYGQILITENEIRAALAGFDNFLVYSLSKTYKNDLISLIRLAYYTKYYNRFKALGRSDDEAKKEAYKKTDWFWKLTGGNIAGPFNNQLMDVAPDKGDGSAELDPEVLKDLQILHSFVNEIGRYYGKKYMVSAPGLKSYRDNRFADISLSTEVGPAYVFQGGGDIHYNYVPTNDGAWEEYGNIIDDSIAVGSKEWISLSDDLGKIKPILGYNANEYFDNIRAKICQLSINQFNEYSAIKNNPFWSYDAYDYMMGLRDGSCGNSKFVLPSLDISSLNNTDYVITEVSGTVLTSLPAIQTGILNNWPNGFTKTTAYDAFGSGIFHPEGQAPLKKLYVATRVEEKIAFLNPANLSYPRVLIDAPGITLSSSSAQYAKDPNRTVISNVAAEDLGIYLHSVDSSKWDYDWIRYMIYYISPIAGADYMIGNYASSANASANFVELAPKAAHPFFAGIPVKSNQYSYGPWSNNPFLDYQNALGESDSTAATRGINNFISNTNVEIIEDFVPWNYGGSAYLDAVAYNEIEKKLNYQTILETAQIDIPGLPLFDLGGAFTSGNFNLSNIGLSGVTVSFTDVKDNDFVDRLMSLMPMANAWYVPPALIATDIVLDYKYIAITGTSAVTDGPIISNVQTSIGQGGVFTTYSFRTYTQKLGLFNREKQDRIKKLAANDRKRQKQLASIQQESANLINSQSKFLQDKRLENASFSGKDFSSKLYGWSPSTVLIGQSEPYIKYLDQDPPYFEPTGLYRSYQSLNTRTQASSFVWNTGLDIGNDSTVINSSRINEANIGGLTLANTLRHKTSVGMYELKEVNAQLEKDYGLQSVMSLDGLFSPVSFYPTLKNSTFNYSLYDTATCPFCGGSKIITTYFNFYKVNQTSSKKITENTINIYCDKCARSDELPTSKLKGTITTSATSQSIETLPPYIVTSGTSLQTLLEFNALSSSSSSISSSSSSSSASSTSSSAAAGVTIPINLVNLNPIVVPYGSFKNQNVQNYSGIHPEGSGVHEDLSIGAYSSSNPRTFIDRCRHSIEIVGRGAIKPANLSIHNNLGIYIDGTGNYQPDFYHKDLALMVARKNREGLNVEYPMNQRFMGLRGPLVMHAWGYDFQGYPVPNAADEPYEIDKYGRPRRFKIKIKDTYPKRVKYKDLQNGDSYKLINSSDTNLYTKGLSYPATNGPLPDTEVSQYIYEDDLTNGGGFPASSSNNNSQQTNLGTDRTADYQGSIISKTQKWTATGASSASYPSVGATGGKWSEKKKLKEFYLNWAERPDLWPVGPIDLRWDETRRVWGMKSSDTASIYKMVYVTLEQDLTKSADTDETYPARGFLDDIQYSAEPLPSGYRRLVYLKDRGGYTAPRGAKLLCRYDKDSGFYEPVSKQSFIVGGIISNGSSATIEMSYVQGRKRGEPVPTMIVPFDNPFSFNTISGNKGLFTFINGKWTLTAAKEN